MFGGGGGGDYVFGPCIIMETFPVLHSFDAEKRVGYFTLIVFLVSCDC